MELHTGQDYMFDLLEQIKKQNLSVKKICLKAKISERSFRRWLNDERSPKISDVSKLYRVLNE